ncbi:hypothetical protein TWF281_009787 [Arthrobotrys megalospora]
MPFIPRVPSIRPPRVIMPPPHSFSYPHAQPRNGRPNTSTHTKYQNRSVPHQQPLSNPEPQVPLRAPHTEIDYVDVAVRAAARENLGAAPNTVRINEDGSKVYVYKQSDGKEVLVTVAVGGEGVAGLSTGVATAVVEEKGMTRTGLITLASSEGALIVLLSLILLWIWTRNRRERKKLRQKNISEGQTDEIPEEVQSDEDVDIEVASRQC